MWKKGNEMEGKETVQEAGIQPVRKNRDVYMERFAERFPGVDANDEDAFYGKLMEESDRIDRSDAAQKELGNLLASDPRSAGFLMVLRKGGNPMEYLIEQYGDDFREALADEGKAKELSEAFSKYAERKAKDRELQERAEGNIQRMLDELDAAQAEGSFTDEDAGKAYSYLYGDGGLLERIITNDITKEDWMMLMKAADYDAMKSGAEAKAREAREEGEIAGRNANIDIQRRRRAKADGMPSDISQSGKPGGGRQEDPLLANLDRITGRHKSIWED